MKKLILITAVLAFGSNSRLALAQHSHGGGQGDMMKCCQGMMQGGGMQCKPMMAECQKMMGGHSDMETKKPVNEAAAAYKAANDEMHKSMTMEFTGDADLDMVRGMVPHHKGAIDMARIVLKYGKDAEVRKLAEDIIKAQELEIVQLQAIMQRLKK